MLGFRPLKRPEKFVWRLQGEIVKETSKPNLYTSFFPRVYDEDDSAPICEYCEYEKDDCSFYATKEFGLVCSECLTCDYEPEFDPNYNFGC